MVSDRYRRMTEQALLLHSGTADDVVFFSLPQSHLLLLIVVDVTESVHAPFHPFTQKPVSPDAPTKHPTI